MREDKQPTGDDASFDARVLAAVGQLMPAEQRVARFFVDRKQEALLGSAAQIGALAGASDATVVRTAKSLGFDSLSALREVLLSELTGAASPGRRLARTLEEAGDGPSAALQHVIGIHEEVLDALKRPELAEGFGRAVGLLADAPRRHVFGIGPSGALADYAALQFNRIGLPTFAMSVPGVALADRLLWLEKGDAVLMMAYAPLYREVSVTLEEAQRKGASVILISDNLGPSVEGKVFQVLPIPRGKADHLAMHGGTMVLIEALIIALAGQRRAAALDALERLSLLRGNIDRDWSKRGIRKK